MHPRLTIFAIATLAAVGCIAGGSPAAAQTVQLPTFDFFGVSTTVVVPDRGQMILGGVGRSQSGMSQFGGGLGGQSALGNASQAGSVTVSVFVHDFEAMDEALLAEASARRARLGQLPLRLPAEEHRPAESTPSRASIVEIRSAQADAAAQREREALDFFQRAQAAEADGKSNVARIYYRMAERRASGELKVAIAACAAANGSGSVAASAR